MFSTVFCKQSESNNEHCTTEFTRGNLIENEIMCVKKHGISGCFAPFFENNRNQIKFANSPHSRAENSNVFTKEIMWVKKRGSKGCFPPLFENNQNQIMCPTAPTSPAEMCLK